MAVVRHVQSRRSTQAVQCPSGGSSGVGSVSFGSSTDAQWNATQTYSDYYDASCAQIERVATLTYPSGSSNAATGTTSDYSHGGAIIGFATMQTSWTSTSVTVTTAGSATVNGGVIGRSGGAVLDRRRHPDRSHRIAERVIHRDRADDRNGQRAVHRNDLQRQLARARSAAVGHGLGAERRHRDGLAQRQRHGDRQRLTGTGGTYSVTDSTANVTASGSYTGSALLTLTLKQGGTTLARFTIDVDGNGTITYADNTTQNVAGFTIFG
jgi:hypothetical protein